MKKAQIRDLRAYIIESNESGADYHNQQSGHWIIDTPIANPMSVYEDYKASRASWGINALGTVVVEAELDDGTIGIGASIGGEPACYIIEKHLRRFVVGQDPRNVELMWDQMWRATMPYGRKGLPIQAISAVDLALWDLLGKLRGEPVYALLGGKTKERLPVYATTARPDLAKAMGFHGAKIPCRYGPADGDEGLRKNVAAVAEARAQVGPDFPLRLDCYMGLTVPYTIKLAQALKPYNLHWIEECLPPDDYDGYAELKAKIDWCLITTGEHEYTRYGFRELIARKCADILQPDINWVGGLTEARRIVAMAAAYDTPVIPHGSSVFSYHMQYAFTNCPIAEFLVMSPQADRIVPLFGDLFINEPLPKDGYLDLTDAPGWGVELNRGALNLRRPYENAAYEMRNAG
jgi:L-rhamnonate dehydratase